MRFEKAADVLDGCVESEGIKTQGKLYKDPRKQDRASYRSGEAAERLEQHQSRRRQMIKHIIHIWHTNTCVSPDKQQTPRRSHILILPFCIRQCRHSLSPDPWGRLKLFLLFLHLEAAPYERLSLWLLSGWRGGEKRRREEDQGGGGGAQRAREESAQSATVPRRAERSWKCRRMKVGRSESDSSDRRLPQRLFDPLPVRTAAVLNPFFIRLPLLWGFGSNDSTKITSAVN